MQNYQRDPYFISSWPASPKYDLGNKIESPQQSRKAGSKSPLISFNEGLNLASITKAMKTSTVFYSKGTSSPQGMVTKSLHSPQTKLSEATKLQSLGKTSGSVDVKVVNPKNTASNFSKSNGFNQDSTLVAPNENQPISILENESAGSDLKVGLDSDLARYTAINLASMNTSVKESSPKPGGENSNR